MSRLFLIIGIILLLLTEILRVYFIMPFPGSQQSDTIGIAYQIEQYKWPLRILGLLLVAGPTRTIFLAKKRWPKVILFLVFGLYAVIFFFFNFRFEADKMFYQPGYKSFAAPAANKIDSDRLVIGVEINGESKAFPIQLIGYHHQVRDSIGGIPVMITYCTVCRTGRVYSPVFNGKLEKFRLVGMDHFNAMFEDQTTKSWWRQATGVAVAGPLKGNHLQEIPSRQTSLAAWTAVHPNTAIFQGDSNYQIKYEHMAGFDIGTIDGHLEKRDSASWAMKSWVVGILSKGMAKAYDWNDLVKSRMIQDSIGKLPILVLLENDTTTFAVYSRSARNLDLYFTTGLQSRQLIDTNTHSVWNLNGTCTSGVLKDAQLEVISAYQEFWHSWKQFHPNTTQYKP